MRYAGNFRHRKLYLPRNYQKLPISRCSTVVCDNIVVPFAAKYDSKTVESNKYDEWDAAGYFHFQPQGNANTFSMILPPPNITGTLHLGHALTITIQDILCRWKRMQGCPVVWVPGTDHAGIATQVLVEKNLLKETGQTRHEIGQEKFLQLVNEWKVKKMDKINSQLKQLGASVDWSRYYFTMDSKQSEAVFEGIKRMFDDGLLYREKSLVNWSCYLQSTISDYEIEYMNLDKATKVAVPGYEEPVEFGKIVNFSYKVVNSEEEVTVSTTRLETIFGDVAVAVHPKTERYAHLKGSYVRNPLNESIIPIIFDEAVDSDFGTGAVKITPGHSKNDFEIGKRHNLPIVTILTETGHLNEICGEFAKLSRFTARGKILTRLSQIGSLKEVRDHKMQLPLCSRSGDVVEQMIKPQWFIHCNKLAGEAIEAVERGVIVIEPEKHKDSYFRWLSNCQDWCISRQIWWGHQIPLYKTDCGWIAAKSEDEAKSTARIKLGYESKIMERDKDVLDTWFSSAILPFSVFNWPQEDDHLKKYYPLSVMETGADILNFWVVRMILMGLYFTKNIPFKKILLHGMICDSRGRKMSKSLGNVVEFDHIINGVTLKDLNETVKTNHKAGLLSSTELEYVLKFQKELFPNGIAPCGADALRLTLASLEFKDAVIHFNPIMCRENAAFCNKMWQASKFIIGWALNLRLDVHGPSQPQTLWQQWLLDRLSQTVSTVNDGLQKNDFHVATRALKNFFHRDLCDIYLEIAKPILKNGATEEAKLTCSIMLYCLEVFLRLMSPVMPFVTDELYTYLPTSERQSIWKTSFPRTDEYSIWENEDAVHKMDLVKDVVTGARSLIQQLQYRKYDAEIAVSCEGNSFLQDYCSVMKTLIRCKSLAFYNSTPSRIPGLVFTVDDKALVFLVLREITDQQIGDNMKLLQMQMARSIKELNVRLDGSKVAKNPNRRLEEKLREWRNFQSEVDAFFKKSMESDSLKMVDLQKATRFVTDAYTFKYRIIEALKASRLYQEQ